MNARNERVRRIALCYGAILTLTSLYACSAENDAQPVSQQSDAATPDAADAGAIDSGDASDLDGPSFDSAPLSSAPAAPGDRQPHVSEPIPDTFLVQQGGRYINVRKPPLGTMAAARGDGSCVGGGDTKAFRDAFDYLRDRFLAASGVGVDGGTLTFPNYTYDDTNYWIYVPDGTYCVNDTLIYDGPSLQSIYYADYPSKPLGPWFDLTRVRVIGESREGTVIRLADNTTSFADPANPKPVLALQHPDTTFNNINAWNVVRNLTVDVGKGNPGAAALLAQGANSMGIQNLLLRSTDVGSVGMWMPIGSVQGSIHDVTIEGFDNGVLVGSGAETNPLLEYMTVRGQKSAGIAIKGAYVSMRKLAIDESSSNAPALLITQKAVQAVLLDSVLTARAGADVAIDDELDSGTILFVRNVMTSGYAKSVRTPSMSLTSPNVSELVVPTATSLFDSGVPTSLNLPVEEVPAAAWQNPATDWANVEDYRDGGADDSTAVQAALNSGKPVIVFAKSAYTLVRSVNIPSTVQRVDFMFANVGPARPLTVEHSALPLVLENLRSDDFSIVVSGAAVRDIAMKNGTLAFANNVSVPVKLWLETSGTQPSAAFSGSEQQTWMHSNDTEYKPIQTIVDGGTVWLMGYKTEGGEIEAGHQIVAGTVISATNGAKVEVLGGYTNVNAPPPTNRPMINEVDSSLSFVGSVIATGADVFTPVVSETHGTTTKTGAYGLFVPYGNGPGNPPRAFPGSLLIPLFVGR